MDASIAHDTEHELACTKSCVAEQYAQIVPLLLVGAVLKRAADYVISLQCDGLIVHNGGSSSPRIRRGFASLVSEELPLFQAFDVVAEYYDSGQSATSSSPHEALDFELAKNVADYCSADSNACRLLLVANCVCAVL